MPRWFEALWLISLAPTLGTVLLDLAHGTPRPAVWLGRAVPVLLWLALVAWARAGRSPLARQVRVELRLALPAGLLLLVSSGSALVQDAVPGTSAAGLLSVLPWVLAVVLPAAAVTLPMSVEHERGTLESLLSAPGGARVFELKFALSAALVCLSWLLLEATPMSGDAWWFALGGHVLAVATVPTWFFLARTEAATLGTVVLVPYFIVLPVGSFAPEAVKAVAALYVVLVLALLPRAVRRGLSLGPVTWLSGTSPGGGRGPRRVLLREQRDAGWMVGAGLLAGGTLFFRGDGEAAIFMTWCFCAVSALLSPALAFAEARRQGTLEQELAALPRRRVLLRRAGGSLLTTVALAVFAPLFAVAVVDTLKPAVAIAWTLAMLVVWCIGVAASVHVRSAGAGVVAGLGAAVVAFVAHFWGFGVGFFAAASAGSAGGTFLSAMGAMPKPPIVATEVLLPLSLAVLGAAALLVAGQRFLSADRLQLKVVLPAVAGSVVVAMACGVLAVTAG